MSAIDWTQHSPAEIFSALQSAPKVAGPWTKAADDYTRRTPFDGRCVARDGGRMVLLSSLAGSGTFAFPTRDEADAELRRLGWVLV